MRTRSLALLIPLALAAKAVAVDVEGVLPASLDQPRIYIAISKDAKSPPLAAKASAGGLADLLGGALEDGKKPGKDDVVEQFAVEAFLDTGASGVMLSKSTAEGLGIQPIKTATGGNVTFYDVGVAGKEPFLVAPQMYFRYCEYSSNTQGDDYARYVPASAPIRLKIRESTGLIDQLTGGIDVAGMPLMLGKVMVCDARPLAKFDKMKTSLVPPGDKSIPAADVVVPITYVDYARFTQTEPKDGPKVTLAPNPMIGPDPFNKADKTPPITMTHNGKQATLTMLLDTGAASSMISTAKAKALGIAVDASGKLTNVPAKEQFTLPIGGIGGTKNVNGFYVDVVQLPAARGQPVRYLKAPVLVMDITVNDEKTGQPFTLDGVFGVNYLVASANVSTGLNAGVDDIHDGPFDFFVIDHVKKTMGLTLSKAVAGDAKAADADAKPEPAEAAPRRPTRGSR